MHYQLPYCDRSFFNIRSQMKMDVGHVFKFAPYAPTTGLNDLCLQINKIIDQVYIHLSLGNTTRACNELGVRNNRVE